MPLQSANPEHHGFPLRAITRGAVPAIESGCPAVDYHHHGPVYNTEGKSWAVDCSTGNAVDRSTGTTVSVPAAVRARLP